MKILILAMSLFSSVSALAQHVTVFPRIINFGNAVQVQIYNSTEDDIHCSGSVTMHTQSNRIETNFFSDYIRSHQTAFSPMYYLMDHSDRISYANENINCYKAN